MKSLHLLNCHIRPYEKAIKKLCGFRYCISARPCFIKALLIKSLLNQISKWNAKCNQLCRACKCIWCYIGILEHASVVNHSCIKTHRHVVVDLIFLEKCIKYLTCRTDLTLYIIDITKNRITYMVINHYTLLCTVKKFFSCTNTV